MTKIKELLEHYKTKKNEINKRLKEFESINEKSDEEIFAELAFCNLTSSSNADRANKIIEKLKENRLLFDGTENEIRPFLNTVRFGSTKAIWIVTNRNYFSDNGKIKIKEKLVQYSNNPILLREWLKKNIMGLGWKESSHFIRNIGLSHNQLAILDRHILRNLNELGIIDSNEPPSTKSKYLEIEEKMKQFSKEIGIPLDELDITLFSKQTGREIKYIK